MARLTKRDVELLTSALDSELLVDALRTALHKVLDVEPFENDWAALVNCAAQRSGWPNDRRWATINRDPDTLDALIVELNELRTLRQHLPTATRLSSEELR